MALHTGIVINYDIEPFAKYGEFATESAYPHEHSPLPVSFSLLTTSTSPSHFPLPTPDFLLSKLPTEPKSNHIRLVRSYLEKAQSILHMAQPVGRLLLARPDARVPRTAQAGGHRGRHLRCRPLHAVPQLCAGQHHGGGAIREGECRAAEEHQGEDRPGEDYGSRWWVSDLRL